MIDIKDILLPPGVPFLEVIPVSLVFLLTLHLIYLAITLGLSLITFILSRSRGDGFRHAKERLPASPGAILVFGLMPLPVIGIFYQVILGETMVPVLVDLLKLGVPALLGFTALAIYRRVPRPGIGAIGIIFVSVYIFHFLNLMSLLVYPEKWPFLKGFLPFPLFSITPLLHFALFLLLAGMVSGSYLLVTTFAWGDTRIPRESPLGRSINRYGSGLVIGGALLAPLPLFIDLFTLPGFAQGTGTFILAVIPLAAGVFALRAGIRSLGPDNTLLKGQVLLLAILSGITMTWFSQHLVGLQIHASRDMIARLETDSMKARARVIAQREEVLSAALVVDSAEGERVFLGVCATCHAFDRKVIGPPMNAVLGKYRENPTGLESFLKNPVKVDPQFPAMPNPGLRPLQVKAVVKYLLETMKEKP